MIGNEKGSLIEPLNPDYAGAHYNIACAYSLKNEKTLSVEFLQKAITIDRSLIENAKMDSDFDNIRESPEFQQLISTTNLTHRSSMG